MQSIIQLLNKLFSRKVRKPGFNIHHPDVANNIEFAFEAGGRKYYKFVKDFQIPTGRYKFVEAYLYESELRMTLSTLNGYMDELSKNLDATKGVVNLEKAFMVIWAIRSRCKLAFSPETIERLASVIYFDETEDLSDFDTEYGEKKIAFWKKNNSVAFFLTRPISDLLQLNDFLETSFPDYLRQIAQAEGIIKSLTFDPETQSTPNLSNQRSTSSK